MNNTIYQCRSCRKFFKPPKVGEGYACICILYDTCPCHCGDQEVAPIRYGDGTAYQEETTE